MDGEKPSGTKANLPIHMILGVSEYARIKTKHVLRIGTPGELIVEYAAFGGQSWQVGKKRDLTRCC